MRKKVLITGGSSDLGRAITNEFARHNCDLIITYHNDKTSVEQLKKAIESEYGVSVKMLRLDLESEEECGAIVEHISELHVLVNNAAYSEDKNFDEFDQEDFLKTYRTNVTGSYFLSIALQPLLEKSRGCIVNIASTNGIDSMYKESITYDASKAALINLTKNLSVALAPSIRVNAVAPGWIDTKSTRNMDSHFKEAMENTNLFHRFASPDEIAKIVYFVASDEASYMTGSIIRIDGGNNYGNR